MPASAGDISITGKRVPFRLFLLLALLLLVDQASKYFVRNRLHPLETVDILPALQLQHVRNRGIAFGLLDGYGSIIIPVGIIIVAIIIVATLLVRDQERYIWPLALLLAGASGNLIDRIIFGSVTDFISLPHWPAFNFADIFIVVGVVLLFYEMIVSGDAKAEADAG